MQPSISLTISELVIERGDRVLCDGLTVSVQSGEIIRVAGENGAGKSSLLKVLAGVMQPTDGMLQWRDEDVTLHRDVLQQDLLYIGHGAGVKSLFTVEENLRWYFPNATGPQISNALLAVNLSGYEETPAAQLSAGQKRRIALARLWLTEKLLWLLDEPFTALDQSGVEVLEKRLQEHIKNDGMVLLTTHQPLNPLLQAREITLV